MANICSGIALPPPDCVARFRNDGRDTETAPRQFVRRGRARGRQPVDRQPVEAAEGAIAAPADVPAEPDRVARAGGERDAVALQQRSEHAPVRTAGVEVVAALVQADRADRREVDEVGGVMVS